MCWRHVFREHDGSIYVLHSCYRVRTCANNLPGVTIGGSYSRSEQQYESRDFHTKPKRVRISHRPLRSKPVRLYRWQCYNPAYLCGQDCLLRWLQFIWILSR